MPRFPKDQPQITGQPVTRSRRTVRPAPGGPASRRSPGGTSSRSASSARCGPPRPRRWRAASPRRWPSPSWSTPGPARHAPP